MKRRRSTWPWDEGGTLLRIRVSLLEEDRGSRNGARLKKRESQPTTNQREINACAKDTTRAIIHRQYITNRDMIWRQPNVCEFGALQYAKNSFSTLCTGLPTFMTRWRLHPHHISARRSSVQDRHHQNHKMKTKSHQNNTIQLK